MDISVQKIQVATSASLKTVLSRLKPKIYIFTLKEQVSFFIHYYFQNTVKHVIIIDIYVDYIRAKYEQNSLQLITNSTLDLPVGTSSIQLSCSIPNATWVHPQTPYISQLSTNSSVLEISIFTIGEAGYYTCIGNDTVCNCYYRVW